MNGSEQADLGTADVWVREFMAEYPKAGKCASHLVEHAFFEVVGTDRSKFDALMVRLAAHKLSARWTERGGRFIPRADKYLRDGTHEQDMPSAAVVMPTYTEWHCPHVEYCDHRGQCAAKNTLGAERYPVRA